MGELGLGAGLAALAFWGFVGTVVVASVWSGIRKRDAQHETVRRMIESGQPIDHELMDKLLSLSDNGASKRPDRDFKITGLWLLPVSVGLALFGLIMGVQVPPVMGPLLGAAALTASIGVGCMVASKIAGRWYPEDDDPAADQLKA